MKPHVEIVDVTLRDGLQLLQTPVPLADKLALLDQAVRAGLKRLELGSFVNPKVMPQFSDTREVLEAAKDYQGLHGSVLIPNAKGFERAETAGAEEVVWVVSASEEHNQANLRRSIADSLADLAPVLEEAQAIGIHVRLAVATAFHCPFAGPTSHEAVLRVLDRAMEGGSLVEVVLADTIGKAHPHEVAALTEVVAKRYQGLRLGFHAHDTYGRGIANIKAAYEAGATVFDGALAGLGGCPFAPGAAGNVSTEEVNRFFEAAGVATGLDAVALAHAAEIARRFGPPMRVPALNEG